VSLVSRGPLNQGARVKPGFESKVLYSHSSFLKTAQKILNVPVLKNVESANDFSDFFAPHPPRN
jgi:hypothetical protein